MCKEYRERRKEKKTKNQTASRESIHSHTTVGNVRLAMDKKTEGLSNFFASVFNGKPTLSTSLEWVDGLSPWVGDWGSKVFPAVSEGLVAGLHL